jgi:CO/xanthine dehydrogenase Mo-binding subunit
MAFYAQQLGIPPAQDVRRAPPAAPAQPEQFDVIRKPVPRLHGYGVVTSQGQYTEHMRMAGMLYTRTLRSPHPHAKVQSLDTKKAEALPGVVAVLHQRNLPEMYRDVKLGSGPPDRFLFATSL